MNRFILHDPDAYKHADCFVYAVKKLLLMFEAEQHNLSLIRLGTRLNIGFRKASNSTYL